MQDFLIVGLGYSGLSFSREVEMHGNTFTIIDPCLFNSASFISGGLLNPVTGRSYNVQWNIEQLLDTSKKLYSGLESLLGIKFLYPVEIVKIHKSEAALAEWYKKKEKPEIQNYVSLFADASFYESMLHMEPGSLLIHGGFRIDAKLLFIKYIEWLGQHEKLIRQQFDHAQLIIKPAHFEYGLEHYKYIVFCEGIAAMDNPFFKGIPFKSDKGECLILKIEGLPQQYVIHKGIILIPLGNDRFWAGATNRWYDLSNVPTPESRAYLEGQLKTLLKIPYEIIDQFAAVRPTIRDRSPVVGSHHKLKNMFIFNGMGTKGVALAPFYARLLAGHIFNQKEIPREGNISRFYDLPD